MSAQSPTFAIVMQDDTGDGINVRNDLLLHADARLLLACGLEGWASTMGGRVDESEENKCKQVPQSRPSQVIRPELRAWSMRSRSGRRPNWVGVSQDRPRHQGSRGLAPRAGPPTAGTKKPGAPGIHARRRASALLP